MLPLPYANPITTVRIIGITIIIKGVRSLKPYQIVPCDTCLSLASPPYKTYCRVLGKTFRKLKFGNIFPLSLPCFPLFLIINIGVVFIRLGYLRLKPCYAYAEVQTPHQNKNPTVGNNTGKIASQHKIIISVYSPPVECALCNNP